MVRLITFQKIWTVIVIMMLPIFITAQVYTDYIGMGHMRGVSVNSSGTQAGSPLHTINRGGIDSAYMRVQAARFLSQATFGANKELIEEVANKGIESWIDEQLQIQPTSLQEEVEYALETWYFRCLEAGKTEGECQEFATDWGFKFNYGWWQALMEGEDLLRQRVAFALSEIFVISGLPNTDDPYARVLANYYDLLMRNAFGNYEDLLYEITLHPAMGTYLSHFNNPRTIPEANIRPDENYAREVMQLFSIGLFELNMDGTQKLDSLDNAIPTYNSDDVREFAKVFTGLGNGVEDGEFFTPPLPQLVDYFVPMKMYEFWHEPGEKKLLNGFVVPAEQTGLEDIKMGVKHLSDHANTAPFISYRLIQRLVKSNPTPAYVERIANVFENNGEGVRGDLGAVVKAILLDPEARSCEWLDHPENGKLREPVTRYTHVLKALNAGNETGEYWNTPYFFYQETRQLAMFAPSVFNFFLPDYQPNGPVAEADLVAPEFQIHNSSTSLGYFNMAYLWSFADYLMANEDEFYALEKEVPGENKVQYNAEYLGNINNPAVLLDELDLLFCNGQLSDETRAIILPTISQLNAYPEARARLALYLILISADYNVTR
ncbi:MAG: DUF1800 domain-containing protein [Bacteroidota bacterium]